MINAVNQKVAELGTKVENLTTDLTALTGRVTTVETEIGEIYKQLAQTSAIIGQCINVFNAELGPTLCDVECSVEEHRLQSDGVLSGYRSDWSLLIQL